MTHIQQISFELASPYMGRPYYVSGNALYTAIARRVDDHTRQSLQVSHGQFLPSTYGSLPEEHSQNGFRKKIGQSLPPVEAYEDLFVCREPAQRWVSSKRPRDASNALVRTEYGGRTAFDPVTRFAKPEDHQHRRWSVSWYLHAYLHAADPSVLPLDEDVLDGLQVGGARNFGFGELSVQDTQCVDLEDLDYSRVREADALRIELLAPYVLSSTVQDADDQSVPAWWAVDGELRRRQERLVDGERLHDLATVDHGQIVGYDGDRPVETAKNGVRRIGTHSKFGFGEFRLRPVNADTSDAKATRPGSVLA